MSDTEVWVSDAGDVSVVCFNPYCWTGGMGIVQSWHDTRAEAARAARLHRAEDIAEYTPPPARCPTCGRRG